MERWHAKVIALVGCFLIPFVCTVLPVKVSDFFERKGRVGQTILGYMMCFGGGVFFSTYILHMAPEARSILNLALEEYDVVLTYPLADLIMAMGFFLVLLTETLIMVNNRKRRQRQVELSNRCVQFNTKNTNSCSGSDCNPVGNKLSNYESNGTSYKKQVQMKDIEDLAFVETDCSLYGTGSCCKDPEEVTIQANAQDDTEFLPHPASHGEHHSHEADILSDPHSSRALILLVALSFHRIFEGMSVGLQKTTHNVFALFMAVMCHEAAIGFSLGLQFVKNKWSTKLVVLACFLCSLIMPVGVLVGTLIKELGDTSTVLDVVNGVLQSLATGTFIYVTFFEILQEELSHDSTSLGKVFSVFFGFALMAALSAIPEEQPEDLLGHSLITHMLENVTTLAP